MFQYNQTGALTKSNVKQTLQTDDTGSYNSSTKVPPNIVSTQTCREQALKFTCKTIPLITNHPDRTSQTSVHKLASKHSTRNKLQPSHSLEIPNNITLTCTQDSTMRETSSNRQDAGIKGKHSVHLLYANNSPSACTEHSSKTQQSIENIYSVSKCCINIKTIKSRRGMKKQSQMLQKARADNPSHECNIVSVSETESLSVSPQNIQTVNITLVEGSSSESELIKTPVSNNEPTDSSMNTRICNRSDILESTNNSQSIIKHNEQNFNNNNNVFESNKQSRNMNSNTNLSSQTSPNLRIPKRINCWKTTSSGKSPQILSDNVRSCTTQNNRKNTQKKNNDNQLGCTSNMFAVTDIDAYTPIPRDVLGTHNYYMPRKSTNSASQCKFEQRVGNTTKTQTDNIIPLKTSSTHPKISVCKRKRGVNEESLLTGKWRLEMNDRTFQQVSNNKVCTTRSDTNHALQTTSWSTGDLQTYSKKPETPNSIMIDRKPRVPEDLDLGLNYNVEKENKNKSHIESNKNNSNILEVTERMDRPGSTKYCIETMNTNIDNTEKMNLHNMTFIKSHKNQSNDRVFALNKSAQRYIQVVYCPRIEHHVFNNSQREDNNHSEIRKDMNNFQNKPIGSSECHEVTKDRNETTAHKNTKLKEDIKQIRKIIHTEAMQQLDPHLAARYLKKPQNEKLKLTCDAHKSYRSAHNEVHTDHSQKDTHINEQVHIANNKRSTEDKSQANNNTTADVNQWTTMRDAEKYIFSYNYSDYNDSTMSDRIPIGNNHKQKLVPLNSDQNALQNSKSTHEQHQLNKESLEKLNDVQRWVTEASQDFQDFSSEHEVNSVIYSLSATKLQRSSCEQLLQLNEHHIDNLKYVQTQPKTENRTNQVCDNRITAEQQYLEKCKSTQEFNERNDSKVNNTLVQTYVTKQISFHQKINEQLQTDITEKESQMRPQKEENVIQIPHQTESIYRIQPTVPEEKISPKPEGMNECVSPLTVVYVTEPLPPVHLTLASECSAHDSANKDDRNLQPMSITKPIFSRDPVPDQQAEAIHRKIVWVSKTDFTEQKNMNDTDAMHKASPVQVKTTTLLDIDMPGRNMCVNVHELPKQKPTKLPSEIRNKDKVPKPTSYQHRHHIINKNQQTQTTANNRAIPGTSKLDTLVERNEPLTRKVVNMKPKQKVKDINEMRTTDKVRKAQLKTDSRHQPTNALCGRTELPRNISLKNKDNKLQHSSQREEYNSNDPKSVTLSKLQLKHKIMSKPNTGLLALTQDTIGTQTSPLSGTTELCHQPQQTTRVENLKKLSGKTVASREDKDRADSTAKEKSKEKGNTREGNDTRREGSTSSRQSVPRKPVQQYRIRWMTRKENEMLNKQKAKMKSEYISRYQRQNHRNTHTCDNCSNDAKTEPNADMNYFNPKRNSSHKIWKEHPNILMGNAKNTPKRPNYTDNRKNKTTELKHSRNEHPSGDSCSPESLQRFREGSSGQHLSPSPTSLQQVGEGSSGQRLSPSPTSLQQVGEGSSGQRLSPSPITLSQVGEESSEQHMSLNPMSLQQVCEGSSGQQLSLSPKSLPHVGDGSSGRLSPSPMSVPQVGEGSNGQDLSLSPMPLSQVGKRASGQHMLPSPMSLPQGGDGSSGRLSLNPTSLPQGGEGSSGQYISQSPMSLPQLAEGSSGQHLSLSSMSPSQFGTGPSECLPVSVNTHHAIQKSCPESIKPLMKDAFTSCDLLQTQKIMQQLQLEYGNFETLTERMKEITRNVLAIIDIKAANSKGIDKKIKELYDFCQKQNTTAYQEETRKKRGKFSAHLTKKKHRRYEPYDGKLTASNMYLVKDKELDSLLSLGILGRGCCGLPPSLIHIHGVISHPSHTQGDRDVMLHYGAEGHLATEDHKATSTDTLTRDISSNNSVWKKIKELYHYTTNTACTKSDETITSPNKTIHPVQSEESTEISGFKYTSTSDNSVLGRNHPGEPADNDGILTQRETKVPDERNSAQNKTDSITTTLNSATTTQNKHCAHVGHVHKTHECSGFTTALEQDGKAAVNHLTRKMKDATQEHEVTKGHSTRGDYTILTRNTTEKHAMIVVQNTIPHDNIGHAITQLNNNSPTLNTNLRDNSAIEEGTMMRCNLSICSENYISNEHMSEQTSDNCTISDDKTCYEIDRNVSSKSSSGSKTDENSVPVLGYREEYQERVLPGFSSCYLKAQNRVYANCQGYGDVHKINDLRSMLQHQPISTEHSNKLDPGEEGRSSQNPEHKTTEYQVYASQSSGNNTCPSNPNKSSFESNVDSSKKQGVISSKNSKLSVNAQVMSNNSELNLFLRFPSTEVNAVKEELDLNRTLIHTSTETLPVLVSIHHTELKTDKIPKYNTTLSVDSQVLDNINGEVIKISPSSNNVFVSIECQPNNVEEEESNVANTSNQKLILVEEGIMEQSQPLPSFKPRTETEPTKQRQFEIHSSNQQQFQDTNSVATESKKNYTLNVFVMQQPGLQLQINSKSNSSAATTSA